MSRVRLLPVVGALLVSFQLALAPAPAQAQLSDVACNPGGADPALAALCMVTNTGLPLRLLVKPGARVFFDMDEQSAVVDDDIVPFSVLYAIDQFDVNYDANFAAEGWFAVGKDTGSTMQTGVVEQLGFIKADDVVPWKLALALAYTNPGPVDRRPVLMFGGNEELFNVLDSIQEGTTTAAGIYDDLDASLASGEPAPHDIISRESQGWVNINESFYLLPILQFENLETIAPDLLGLQIAALTSGGVSQQTSACDLTQGGGASCLVDQGGGPGGPLTMDVVFVIDTTNSMQPHIDAVTRAINEAADTLSRKLPDANLLKFGVVGYRDALESTPALEYEVRNFTPELLPTEEFRDLLESGSVAASAAGSGDWSEEVFLGMREAINAQWSPSSARIIILIGDASSHPVGHEKSVTGLSEQAIKELALQNSVYVASIYIDTGNATDLSLARPQFEGVAAGDAESGVIAFSIVNANATSVGLDGGAGGLEAGLRDALGRIVDVLGTGNAGSILTANIDPNDVTSQAIATAVRAAVVDYVGEGATPPSNVQAWVLDRDLTDFGKRSFEVKLMLTRADIQELTDALTQVLGTFREGKVTSGTFLGGAQLLSTSTSYDLKISDTEQLVDSPVVPTWIKQLPYKSEILTMSVEEFRSASADERTRIEENLDKLIALYKDVMSRPESWRLLHDEAAVEDGVYMLGLDNLP